MLLCMDDYVKTVTKGREQGDTHIQNMQVLTEAQYTQEACTDECACTNTHIPYTHTNAHT